MTPAFEEGDIAPGPEHPVAVMAPRKKTLHSLRIICRQRIVPSGRFLPISASFLKGLAVTERNALNQPLRLVVRVWDAQACATGTESRKRCRLTVEILDDGTVALIANATD